MSLLHAGLKFLANYPIKIKLSTVWEPEKEMS